MQSQYEAGLRITDERTLEIVEMVLAGLINKQMVGFINEAGGKAIGLCGKDGNMVVARKLTRTVVDPDSHIERVVDLGFVGEPDKVDITVLTQILGRELIPVLAPVAAAANGGTFNVNADTFAGAVAGALRAKRLLLLTDVPGVLDRSKNLIKQLSVDEARRLIADGTIAGGMIPKVETCIAALEGGVEGVVILDGKVPHAVLLELFTELGAGTLIDNWRADFKPRDEIGRASSIASGQGEDECMALRMPRSTVFPSRPAAWRSRQRPRPEIDTRPPSSAAQPLQPADQIDGGADGGEIQTIRCADIAPENLAKMQSDAEG